MAASSSVCTEIECQIRNLTHEGARAQHARDERGALGAASSRVRDDERDLAVLARGAAANRALRRRVEVVAALRTGTVTVAGDQQHVAGAVAMRERASSWRSKILQVCRRGRVVGSGA